MKIKIFLFSVSLLLILAGCDAQKAYIQRRNLMMPNKSDLPRNSTYSGSKGTKTYKVKKNKQRKRKKSFGY